MSLDDRIQELRREAAQGSQEAANEIIRVKIRAGLASELTLGEILGADHLAIPVGLVADYVRRLSLRKKQFVSVEGWVSNPYGQGEYEPSVPVEVTMGALRPGDPDQVEITAAEGQGPIATFEANPRPRGRTFVAGWLWKGYAGSSARVAEEDDDHILVHFDLD